MDYDTKVLYAVILQGIVLLILPAMMTIAYINAKSKIKGKNNIDKNRALTYAISRYKNSFLYSEDERSLGFIYYCRLCCVLLVIVVILLIFVFSFLLTY